MSYRYSGGPELPKNAPWTARLSRWARKYDFELGYALPSALAAATFYGVGHTGAMVPALVAGGASLASLIAQQADNIRRLFGSPYTPAPAPSSAMTDASLSRGNPFESDHTSTATMGYSSMRPAYSGAYANANPDAWYKPPIPEGDWRSRASPSAYNSPSANAYAYSHGNPF